MVPLVSGCQSLFTWTMVNYRQVANKTAHIDHDQYMIVYIFRKFDSNYWNILLDVMTKYILHQFINTRCIAKIGVHNVVCSTRQHVTLVKKLKSY